MSGTSSLMAFLTATNNTSSSRPTTAPKAAASHAAPRPVQPVRAVQQPQQSPKSATSSQPQRPATPVRQTSVPRSASNSALNGWQQQATALRSALQKAVNEAGSITDAPGQGSASNPDVYSCWLVNQQTSGLHLCTVTRNSFHITQCTEQLVPLHSVRLCVDDCMSNGLSLHWSDEQKFTGRCLTVRQRDQLAASITERQQSILQSPTPSSPMQDFLHSTAPVTAANRQVAAQILDLQPAALPIYSDAQAISDILTDQLHAAVQSLWKQHQQLQSSLQHLSKVSTDYLNIRSTSTDSTDSVASTDNSSNVKLRLLEQQNVQLTNRLASLQIQLKDNAQTERVAKLEGESKELQTKLTAMQNELQASQATAAERLTAVQHSHSQYKESQQVNSELQQKLQSQDHLIQHNEQQVHQLRAQSAAFESQLLDAVTKQRVAERGAVASKQTEESMASQRNALQKQVQQLQIQLRKVLSDRSSVAATQRSVPVVIPPSSYVSTPRTPLSAQSTDSDHSNWSERSLTAEERAIMVAQLLEISEAKATAEHELDQLKRAAASANNSRRQSFKSLTAIFHRATSVTDKPVKAQPLSVFTTPKKQDRRPDASQPSSPSAASRPPLVRIPSNYHMIAT